ncbi:MAG: DUF4136 domain-containing protein [Proteobacteria bacterium]|jgi:hypothetical protein|nr:DUF4136 domain-containing protein [Pseudomonadota bacterium]
MKTYFAFLLTLFVLLAGCATSVTKDISVKAEADPKARFSGYKTYAWLGSARIVEDADGTWEPPKYDADAEVKFLINTELRDRGMEEVTSNPDLVVAFALGVDMDALKLKEDPKSKIKSLENVPQGALVVILVDAASGYVIWVGEAEAELQKNMDDKIATERLKYAITEMFKRIPSD